MTRAEKWLWIILPAYVTGFVLFPPRVLLINDEERYVAQAVAFSRGALNLPTLDSARGPLSDFPPGTSLLQTPFVMAGGWRAAAALSVVSVVLLVVFTRRLLRVYELNPGYSILTVAFPGTLFFGRVAMSDVPAAALVALTLWLLKDSETRGARWALGAGVAGGMGLMLREPILLLTAPSFAAASWRHPRLIPFLAVGFIAGVSVRFFGSYLLFGDPLYVRDPGYGFSLRSIAANAPLYALILGLIYPLGAVIPMMYQGRDRLQHSISLALYAALFLAYDYNPSRDSGMARGILLATRFVVPALPLLVVMTAGASRQVLERMREPTRMTLLRVLPLACALLALSAFAIHPLARRLDEQAFALRRAMDVHAPVGIPVVFNEKVLGKYLSPAYGPRLSLPRAAAQPEALKRICRRYGRVRIILLNRIDTEVFRNDARENAAFVATVARDLPLRSVYSAQHGPGLHLNVLESTGCPPG